MNIELAKIDTAVLALLYLGRHDGDRTWKSFDWDAMNRLHEKGYITNPMSKANQSYSRTKASKPLSKRFADSSPKRTADA